jgi:hypothetical protein
MTCSMPAVITSATGTSTWAWLGGEVSWAYDLTRLPPYCDEVDVGIRSRLADLAEAHYLEAVLSSAPDITVEFRWWAAPGAEEVRFAVLARCRSAPDDSAGTVETVAAALAAGPPHLHLEPLTDEDQLRWWLWPLGDQPLPAAWELRRVLDRAWSTDGTGWWEAFPAIDLPAAGRALVPSAMFHSASPVVVSTCLRRVPGLDAHDQWLAEKETYFRHLAEDREFPQGGTRIVHRAPSFARRAAEDLARCQAEATAVRFVYRTTIASTGAADASAVRDAALLGFRRHGTQTDGSSSLEAVAVTPGDVAGNLRRLDESSVGPPDRSARAPLAFGVSTLNGWEAVRLAMLPRAVDGPAIPFPCDTVHAGRAQPIEPGAVFLSYASAASSRLEVVRRQLLHAGFPLWWDTAAMNAGYDVTAQLDKALEAASCVVVVVTADALRSSWVRDYELRRAVQLGRPVFEVLFDGQRPLRPDRVAVVVRSWPVHRGNPDLARLTEQVALHAARRP